MRERSWGTQKKAVHTHTSATGHTQRERDVLRVGRAFIKGPLKTLAKNDNISTLSLFLPLRTPKRDKKHWHFRDARRRWTTRQREFSRGPIKRGFMGLFSPSCARPSNGRFLVDLPDI